MKQKIRKPIRYVTIKLKTTIKLFVGVLVVGVRGEGRSGQLRLLTPLERVEIYEQHPHPPRIDTLRSLINNIC